MVLVSGFAVHLVFAPAHPWACLLRSIARAVCPSAPQGGSLSPRANWVVFATCLVACNARNTRATGLTACKPAWPLAYYSGKNVAELAI